MSRSTNNFSGDLLLLAIASPKLSSTDTLFIVTSPKHWSLIASIPSKIWLQILRSAENNNLTCFKYNKIVGNQATYILAEKLRTGLTEIHINSIQLPILASKISHCIFCTSSLLSFSTPNFRRVCSKTEARMSLKKATSCVNYLTKMRQFQNYWIDAW